MPQKPKTRPPTSFDGYCPSCRENIGWDTLAKLFTGKTFDPDKTFRTRFVCPKCDSVLEVELLLDFSLKEIG